MVRIHAVDELLDADRKTLVRLAAKLQHALAVAELHSENILDSYGVAGSATPTATKRVGQTAQIKRELYKKTR